MRAGEAAIFIRGYEMPRFYVEHDGLWNIYSTIVDDFILPEFTDFHSLKRYVLGETIRDRIKELNTLLTEKPRLNVMNYEEAMERKNAVIEIERGAGMDDGF